MRNFIGRSCLFFLLAVFSHNLFSEPMPSIDLSSVKGFGINTPAGTGGEVLVVNTLAASGHGSLRWALEHKGKRIVVFEVGGVIDLAGSEIRVTEPYLTIAGQTAPSPGITIIRGGLSIRTHDVRIQHIRVRPGDNGKKMGQGWEPDGISVSGADARHVHIDHCSLSWAIDENLSASGPRDKGHDATSANITFSNSIIAEALDYATHKKGKHSKGLLVHDFSVNIGVIGNFFANNDRRNPYFKGHTTGVVVNNLLYNIGNAAVQLGYIESEYQNSAFKPAKARVAVVGNKLVYGRDSYSDLALVASLGDAYVEDNQVINLAGDNMPVTQGAITILKEKPVWPENLQAMPLDKVEASVLANAGARPWDRDAVDLRIINDYIQKRGRIIDSQDQVGGYPTVKPTYRKLQIPATNIERWLASFVQ